MGRTAFSIEKMNIDWLMCLTCILAFLLEDCQGGKFQQHQITFLSNVSQWLKKHFFEGVQPLLACLSDKVR